MLQFWIVVKLGYNELGYYELRPIGYNEHIFQPKLIIYYMH